MPLADRAMGRAGPPPTDHAAGETVDVLPAGATAQASADDEFSAFMAKHSADLLRTAWFLCGDAHRAEELAQQALVRTYAAWSRAGRDPLAYARRVLVNLRVDTWRRRRREVLTAPDPLPARPVAAAARADDRDQLVRALALLTPRQRRVVVLRHLVGLPEAEVAAELGVSVGTVKSTASRGIATLRAAMTEPMTRKPSTDGTTTDETAGKTTAGKTTAGKTTAGKTTSRPTNDGGAR